MTTIKNMKDLPVEPVAALRAEVERDAGDSERWRDEYTAELLSFDWITEGDAWVAIRYLDNTGWLFRITDTETGKQHLAITDESLDFSDGWARGTFSSPEECETWLAELGRKLAEEEVA